MKKLILILTLLIGTHSFAKRLYTVKAEMGFPISCRDIFSNPEYSNLKQVIIEDMQNSLNRAIKNCELDTGNDCVEVNTYTQQLQDDKNTCFAIATAREK